MLIKFLKRIANLFIICIKKPIILIHQYKKIQFGMVDYLKSNFLKNLSAHASAADGLTV